MKEKTELYQKLYEEIKAFTGGDEIHAPFLIGRLIKLFESYSAQNVAAVRNETIGAAIKKLYVYHHWTDIEDWIEVKEILNSLKSTQTTTTQKQTETDEQPTLKPDEPWPLSGQTPQSSLNK